MDKKQNRIITVFIQICCSWYLNLKMIQEIHRAFKRQKYQNRIQYGKQKAGDEAVNTDCLFLNLFRCYVFRLKIHRAFKGKSKSCKGKIIIDLDS